MSMNPGIPQSVWKKLKTHTGEPFNSSFWSDILKLIPQQGPRVDVFETEQDIIIHMELAGLSSAERIKVSSNGKSLIISGELDIEGPEEEDGYIVRERYHGPFSRRIELPAYAKTEEAAARLHEGLLTIWLAKKPEEPERELSVEYKP
jgi:HSP20 family protein